ncbi:MAG: transcription regulator [Gammaproteobacteria bacterium]|nr:transcription regulator [Gammaproteobacteria bacterium]
MNVHATATGPGPADPALSLPRWLWEETKFHLLPWGPHVWRASAARGLGLGFAVLVTLAWLLSGTGHLGPAVVTAWWCGWSVYELACRRVNLPWIKEGPWWWRDFRRASLADLAAYVATKNLLVGVVLFSALSSLGVLKWLGEQPTLAWLH